MVSTRKSPADTVEIVRAAAWPLVAGRTYARILTWIGDAQVVFLGEATRGTHDFHAARAALTRRLIEDRQFSAVAFESDWADAHRVNRYADGRGGRDPSVMLSGFNEFPGWTWRNTAMMEFAAWLHEHNMSRHEAQRVGIFGLDLHCTQASMRGAVEHLTGIDPRVARAARADFALFDEFGEDSSGYVWCTETEAALASTVRQLVKLRARRANWLNHDGPMLSDELFYLGQHRRIASTADDYYYRLLQNRLDGWNGRARHMAEVLDELAAFLVNRGLPPRIVVWAHNMHLGDARATRMRTIGELGLAQVARGRYGSAGRTIGMTTYGGSVVASSEWGGSGEIRQLEPALAGSLEELFHRVGLPRFFLPMDSGPDLHDALSEPLLERAVGFVYRPEQERWSHYLEVNAAIRYDAIMHADVTHPLEPLEGMAEWDFGKTRHAHRAGP